MDEAEGVRLRRSVQVVRVVAGFGGVLGMEWEDGARRLKVQRDRVNEIGPYPARAKDSQQ